MSKTVLFLAVCLCGFVSCSQDETTKRVTSTESVLLVLRDSGLSCGVQKDIIAFEDRDREAFVQLVKKDMTGDRLLSVIETREVNCEQDQSNEQLLPKNDYVVEMSTHAITGTYVVEKIEEQSTSGNGWMASTVYRDGPSYGNMCGNDWPTDYIAEFNGVSGGYTNPASLRITGLNGIGSCFIDGFLRARVYSDNSIRACVGYWSVFFCSGGILPRDMLVWRI